VTEGEDENERGVERPSVDDREQASAAADDGEDPPADDPDGAAATGDAPADETTDPEDEAWLEVSPEEAEARRQRHHERREAHRRRVRKKRRRKRILIGTAVTLATLLVLAGGWFWWTFGGLDRMPQSVGQAGVHAPGTTILLVGSDPAKAVAPASSRTGWNEDLDRGDLVMLLHLNKNHQALFVISIPADAIVQIPGVGPGKLADAATAGGPRLVARTVEEMTGVRLDRMAVLDLNAFREITDVLDGVVIDVPRASCGLPAGERRFDGQAAMDYIALQPCMERKDLDRVERQQSLVKGLIHGALDGGKLTNPFTVNRMLRATASHLALEHGFSYPSMFRTLWSMRRVRSANTTFLTTPYASKPLASQDGTDYVLLDQEADAGLWKALREDSIGQYLALVPDVPVLGRH
jgi:LCP family protein required for cell wall assembly